MKEELRELSTNIIDAAEHLISLQDIIGKWGWAFL
jgi:hypothetical protein